MARSAQRLPQNVPGDLFVDTACIDCDRCRQIAPATFGASFADSTSWVARQPATAGERHRALMALVACPTSAIGSESRASVGEAASAFPEELAPGVYDCGYADEASFGATSYFVRRTDGNVLVDVPRWVPRLADRIAALGGVRWIFFTHRDDVASHARWASRFGARRIIHRADADAAPDAEEVLAGDQPLRLAADLLAIPVPGHTRGSMALLHAAPSGEGFLFTGDHVWARPDGHLNASRGVCWYSWPTQRRSVERLADFSFQHVLPGHGRRARFPSPDDARHEIQRLAREMGR
jgi:glyoxylase-like metal-dependent hydrolase (beta-lactamase superfamily II)